MQTNIFIHAAILDKCKDRIFQYLDCIFKSRLLEKVENVFICFVGNNEIPINKNELLQYNDCEKINLVKVSNNLSDYEIPTLQFIYDFCKNDSDSNVLYLHTKNVGKEINLCIEDQIEYMLHFNVTKWQDCLKNLIEHDTCGVDLRDVPTLHYSGNFWWTKSSHVVKLPSPNEFNDLQKFPNPLNSARHNQEFWICYDKSKKHFSMWDCGINSYERHLHRYSRKNYDTNNFDVTIILQGVIYNESMLYQIIQNYKQLANIIVSSYFLNNQSFYNKLKNTYPEIIFIDNDLTAFENNLICSNNYSKIHSPAGNVYMNNYYYQIKTTESALKFVKTKYVIKTRVDFYFSDMNCFIDEMFRNNDIITIISIYIRSYDYCLANNINYHPSDICYGGKMEIINYLSEYELNNFCLQLGCSEEKKWRHYCNLKLKEKKIEEQDILKNKDIYSDFMSEIFNVYPINKNNCSYNFKGITFINDSIKSSKEYFCLDVVNNAYLY